MYQISYKLLLLKPDNVHLKNQIK